MNYIVVGNGNYSLMVRRYFQATEGKEIAAFTVTKEIIKEEHLEGVPVIATENIMNLFPPEKCRLLMGIGYSNMNSIKAQEFGHYKSLGYKFVNYIHPTTIIEKDVELGEGNNIFEGVILQGRVKLGNGNLIYAGAMVAHETEIGNFNSISVKACVAGGVTIGDNCFLGANSTVKDHVNIANFTLLGAGAYLGRDTMAYDVIAAPRAVLLEGRRSVEFI